MDDQRAPRGVALRKASIALLSKISGTTFAAYTYQVDITKLKLNLEAIMLTWALTFLVIALIAGVLGFSGVMATSAGIAKILFLIFIVLFLVSMVSHALRGRSVV